MSENLPLYRMMFRSTVAHSGVRTAFSVATTILTIFIVRLMGPQEFGKFSLILQLAVTSGLFLSWGSSATLAKFLPELKEKKSQAHLSSQALEISLISILIFVVAFLLLCQFVPSLFPNEIKSTKFLFILFTSLFAIFNVFQGVFRGIGRFIQWSFVEGLNDFFARGLALSLIIFLSLSYQTVLLSYVGALLCSDLYSFAKTRNQFIITDLKVDAQVARFGINMLLGSIVFMMGTSLDAVLLRGLLKDPNEVGYYFAGVRIPQIFQSFLLAPLAIPFIYYFTHPDTVHTREQIIHLGTKLLGVVCGLVSLVFFSFGDLIITLFYGEFYARSIPVLKIYSFVFFVIGLQSFSGPFFMAINKIHIPLYLGFCSVFVLLGLDLWFLPIWQSAGSALANVVMLTLLTLCYAFIMSRSGLKIVRPTLILMIGILLSVLSELLWLPYASIPFFILFIFAVKLFSREEIGKIKLLLSSAAVPA